MDPEYTVIGRVARRIWAVAMKNKYGANNEHKKHDGSYPIIGVNTFLNPKGSAQIEIELARSTDEEKQGQIKRLTDFQKRNAGQSAQWLAKLKQTVIDNGNVFAVLVDSVCYCSLGQITTALYEVGGQYRRNM